MANTVIGALRVVLQADTAAFETGLKGAERALGNFSKGAKGFATAASAAIGAAGIAIGASMKHMINEADNLGKASQKFGVPVEQLSALKYAADLADVSFESLGKGLGKLSRAMVEGAANPAGEAAKNFAALGVSIKDGAGNIKGTEKVFTDIAEKFSTMEDGAEKTALAIKIFGRSGADLIPLLNQGAAGIKGMTDRARELGIVISSDTAAKAEKFNDTLKDVGVAFNAIGLKIAEALLPHLQKLAEWMVSITQEGSKFKWVFENLITDQDIQMLQSYAQSFENLGRIWGALKAIMAAATFDDLKKALAAADAAIETNKKKLEELQRTWMSLGSAGAFDSLDNLPAQLGRVAAATTKANVAALAHKSAIQEFIDATKSSIEAQELEARTMGLGIGERERQLVLLKAEQVERAKNVAMTTQEAAAVAALAVKAQEAALKVAGAKMTEENLTSWDVYQKKLKEINDTLAANPQLHEDAAKSAEKARASMIASYTSVAENAAGAFSDFFATFAGGSKKMFAISKALAISQATIHAMTAFNNALAMTLLPPPFPQIAAAAALAAGMAQVGKIAAQKPPAFATGGAMRIGGAGGVDSQMVSFMGSPGETVRVDQNKYGESGGGKTITLAGVNARDYYRGDVLRDFVANLNEAIGDGLKIKMA